MSKPKSPLDRVREAMENHHKRLHETQSKQRHKRNGKPEKEVATACMKWMESQGWSVQILEAKATYNPKAGRYLRNTSVEAGTVDCLGSTNMGTLCAVEFKAPGRLSTFAADRNSLQRDYLINKISSYCFGCVTDSVDRLELIYNEYLLALEVSREKAKQLLLNWLPK